LNPSSGAPQSFLRWPGGKRWAVNIITPIIHGIKFERYIEPFIGGGSIFFSVHPREAIISDLNTDLIATYKAVKSSPAKVLDQLRQLTCSREQYNAFRNMSRLKKNVDIATRFLYLNRMSFSGMYRVNLKGEFNVPFGGDRDLRTLTESKIIQNASRCLKAAAIESSDFEEVMERAKKGDLVYCDPTYTVAHNNNGFVRYNEKVFRWEDQQRLAKACLRAKKRGVKLIISNAAHESVIELYRDFSECRILERPTNISVKIHARKIVSEALFIVK
jgi:DNA adenine methylase